MSPIVQKLYAFSIARYFDLLRLKHRKRVVLFFRDGGIGDILCTFPSASVLADKHKDDYRIYCTNPGFVSLPALLPGRFHRVLGVKANDLVAKAARRHTVYRFRYPDEDPGRASSKYLADEFSESFGLPDGLPWPQLELGEPSAKVQSVFAGRGEPAVCIHVGPSWLVREWPQAYWEQLVARIRELTGFRVLQIGASKHFREGERKEPPIKGAEDCRDIYSLVETLQIIARCRMLVGIDSGMIHGAVACGIPAVGIFGPTSGVLRLPPRPEVVGLSAPVPCLGCHHRHPRLHWQSGCPHGVRCMQELTPERVLAEAMPLLRSSVDAAG